MGEHDHLISILNRLKLTALRDQLGSLIDEAGQQNLTIRDAVAAFQTCPPRPQAQMQMSRPALGT